MARLEPNNERLTVRMLDVLEASAGDKISQSLCMAYWMRVKRHGSILPVHAGREFIEANSLPGGFSYGRVEVRREQYLQQLLR